MAPKKQYPKRLSPKARKEIIKRRGGDSDKSGSRRKLEIHHKDRDTKNNDPKNLTVLTEKEHDDLHARRS